MGMPEEFGETSVPFHRSEEGGDSNFILSIRAVDINDLKLKKKIRTSPKKTSGVWKLVIHVNITWFRDFICFTSNLPPTYLGLEGFVVVAKCRFILDLAIWAVLPWPAREAQIFGPHEHDATLEQRGPFIYFY